MYADRANRGKMSPAGLTMAVGINAALIGALIWSAPAILVEPDGTLTVYPVDADPPPPPPEPRIEPKKATESARPIETAVPKPVIELPSEPTNKLAGTIDPLPPPPTDTASGTGGVTVDLPKPLPPVMVDAVTDPRYAADLQPEYPAAMRRAGKEGQVVVKVLIGTDGRVKDIQLVSSPDPSFFDATKRQALARWRFKPATRDGIPYESWKTMRLGFRLTDA
ncbi:TonB family protein [Sphingomonas sp. DT-204]|uniref:energy transducer TonB n=1 Tax=Sphingomonas sp. DT-204 TaxID=3396166 RepID=UPI003F1BCFE3